MRCPTEPVAKLHYEGNRVNFQTGERIMSTKFANIYRDSFLRKYATVRHCRSFDIMHCIPIYFDVIRIIIIILTSYYISQLF